MNRSNILIFLPVLLILTGLIFYNFKLKELYDTKEYKSRYKDMVFTAISGIDELDIASANRIRLEVEYGDKEGIWVSKTFNDHVKKEKEGSKLSLDLLVGQDPAGYEVFYHIVLVTRNLKSIVTTSMFKDNAANAGTKISLSNYTLNRLDLKLSPYVFMQLNNMKVGAFNATIGNEGYSKTQLTLGSDNIIENAYFDIPGKSALTLINPKITKATYNVSDSAEVSLSGKVLEVIKK